MADWLGRPDTEADRWHLAEQIGNGQAQDEVRRIFRRRMQFVVTLIGVLVVAAVIAGLAAAGHHSANRNHHHPIALWRTILAGLLLIGGLAVEVWGLLRYRRSRLSVSNRTSPLLALRRREARQVLRQVQGRRPLEPGHVAVARNVAQRLVRQHQLQYLYLGLVAILLGNAVQSTSVSRLGLAVALILLYVGLYAWLSRLVRRATQFLAEHPA